MQSNTDTVVELNLAEKLRKLENLIQMWSARPLTLKGKITVIQSIFISQILYPCSVLYVPQWCIDRLHNMFINFLWNNKRPKIKHTCLIADRDCGGLRFPDIKNKIKALKLVWIQRLFDHSVHAWKECFQKSIKKNIFILIQSAPDPKDLPFTISNFYGQLFSYWHDFHYKDVLGYQDIYCQPLWLNSHILVGGKTVYNKNWIDKGIINIADICSHTGHILPHDVIANKFGLNIDFLHYRSMVSAIPMEWKHTIRNTTNIVNSSIKISDYPIVKIGNTRKPLNKVKCRDFYWSLISNFIEEPTSKSKWTQNYLLTLDDVTWKYIYSLPHRITIDTYLQSFQFKILHRIFTCGKYLHKVGIRENNICTFCKENLVDDIMHYFYECNAVLDLWQSIYNLLYDIFDVRLNLSRFDIIFGIINMTDDSTLDVINYIILLAKCFIFKCKKDNNNIDFTLFCRELKNRMDILKFIMYKNNKAKDFDDKWSILLEFL